MTESMESRTDVLSAFLSTPHGDYSDLFPFHLESLDRVPLFYMHLACWYWDKGKVRDHKLLSSVALCLSSYSKHRQVGVAMLRKMSPRELVNALDFMTIQRKRESKRFFHVPRIVRTEVARYLRERESSSRRFDKTVVSQRAAMHRLYEGMHIVPGGSFDSAYNETLFRRNPLEGTVAWAIKQIPKLDDPTEVAQLIFEYNVPLPVAMTQVGGVTPSLLSALAFVATPMQVMHNGNFFKKNGGFDNEEIRDVLMQKIREGESDKRFVATRAQTAIDASGVDSEVADTLKDTLSKSLKSGDVITRPWAGFIDASSSMRTAIETAKKLFAVMMTATAEDVPFHLYTFDSAVTPIQPKGNTFRHMEDALEMISAYGSTSYGAPVRALHQGGHKVEMMVFVTDDQETVGPTFSVEYPKYVHEMGVSPSVVLVLVEPKPERSLQRVAPGMGVELSVYNFAGDDYSFADLMPVLAQPSITDLALTILEYPLFERLPA